MYNTNAICFRNCQGGVIGVKRYKYVDLYLVSVLMFFLADNSESAGPSFFTVEKRIP